MSNLRQVSLFPCGVINIPPSKSVAHRAIICAGLADGKSVLSNISCSQDISATISCMNQLGMKCEMESDSLVIQKTIKSYEKLLDCGESGSTLRFLIPASAAIATNISFTGQGRLMERPLAPILSAMQANGIAYSLHNNILSLSGRLKPGLFTLPGDISSQFVSGLLFALPLLDGNSEIHITTPLQSSSYVDLTLDIIKQFGISIENDHYQRFLIKGYQGYKPQNVNIESDYSQAAFFLISSVLGCECECMGLLSNSKQGDRKIINIIKNIGAKIITTKHGGLIAKAESKLLPQIIDVSDIPDLVPPLAVLLSFCDGTSRIVNAGRLRYKESDRLHSVTTELNALGADIVEGEDFMVINGVKSLRGGHVKSWGDHRIAMMCAVAAIKSENAVFIEQSDCVAKSYPNFWEDFEKTQNGGVK